MHDGLWSTNRSLNVDYTWCCKDYCTTVENFVIEEGQIASWDGTSITSDLGDLGGCAPNSGQCINDDSTTIWNQTNFLHVCRMIFKSDYQAKFSGNYFIVDEIQ
uniref:Uncharacterized protein n=1 Tax=Romanomermis culicivorax TaxID=13658 RepID=A0A915K4A2_ROMCU